MGTLLMLGKEQRATLAAHLSRVEGMHCITLHEEHAYEVDENTGSMSGVPRREDQPLV